ncbi:DeoR/GlpR family DNA-binding transcription regulator [Enterococcus olivae]
MIKAERQQLILEILDKEKKVIATDLTARLNVSEDTIRRDLRELDSKGLLRRVHSGALRLGPPVVDFQQRSSENLDLKNELAQKALPLLREDTVILIDGSTSNLHLVQNIPLNFRATIITNSPPIATALAYHNNIEVISLGGILYKQSMVNLGIDTVQSLDLMKVDLYIMGIYNIDPQIGLSVPTMPEAQVKRKMVEVSTEVLGLVSSNKFGTVSNQVVCPTDTLTYIVTDKIDKNVLAAYTAKKITIV